MARYADAKLFFSNTTYAPVGARKRFIIKFLLTIIAVSATIGVLVYIGKLQQTKDIILYTLDTLNLNLTYYVTRYWVLSNIPVIIRLNAEIYYIPLIIEGIACIVIFWKLFIRKEIKGILRIRNIILLGLAGYWVYLIMEYSGLKTTQIYRLVIQFVETYPTFGYVFLFTMRPQIYVFILTYCTLLLISYICLKRLYKAAENQSLYDDNAVYAGGHVTGIDMMEKLGYFEVLKNARKVAGRFQKMPKLYFTDTMPNNGYNIANVIVYDINVVLSQYSSNARNWFNSRGTLAHEFGHCYNKDTTSNLVCEVAVNTFFLPIEITLLVLSFLSRFFWWANLGLLVARIPINICIHIYNIVRRITNFLIFRVLGLIGGKRNEIRADRFAVDIGFGAALYADIGSIPDGKGFRAFIRRVFDAHPSNRKRCRLIKNRMIRIYGEKYWNDFWAEYENSYYYVDESVDGPAYYYARLTSEDRQTKLDAAKEMASYYGLTDGKVLKRFHDDCVKNIFEKYGSNANFQEAFREGDPDAYSSACILATYKILSPLRKYKIKKK